MKVDVQKSREIKKNCIFQYNTQIDDLGRKNCICAAGNEIRKDILL